MTASYPIFLFINLKPEYSNAGLVRQLPIFALEYLLGALNTLKSVFTEHFVVSVPLLFCEILPKKTLKP